MNLSKKLLRTGIFSALLFLFSVSSAFAETATPSEPTNQPVSVQSTQPAPFSADEMATLQPQQEALAADTTLQQMQVGAGIDGTIVLSVIVAILIIVLIAAIL